MPCGAAAEKVEANAGVTLTPVSEENSVTDVLGKITSGQADAGLVYVTDAKNAGDKVTAVDFPEAAVVVNTYPIADADRRDTARISVEVRRIWSPGRRASRCWLTPASSRPPDPLT